MRHSNFSPREYEKVIEKKVNSLNVEKMYLDASYENIWERQGLSADNILKDLERPRAKYSQDIRNQHTEEKKHFEENLSINRLSMISSHGSETYSHSESIRSRSESLNIEDFFYDSEIDSDELENISSTKQKKKSKKLGCIIRKHLSVLDENRRDIDDYWSEIRKHVTGF